MARGKPITERRAQRHRTKTTKPSPPVETTVVKSKRTAENQPEPEAVLVPAPPASAERVDKKLVEEAHKKIKTIIESTIVKGLDEVGSYLLDTFYESSVDLLRSRSPKKHASLNKLLGEIEKESTRSRSWMNDALNIAVQTRELRSTGYSAEVDKLTASHRLALVPLGRTDTDAVGKLATKAVKQNWSVRKLKSEVDKYRSQKGEGRTQAPLFLRSLNTCSRLSGSALIR